MFYICTGNCRFMILTTDIRKNIKSELCLKKYINIKVNITNFDMHLLLSGYVSFLMYYLVVFIGKN